MKIENITTSNWENAFRGMRNPYDSWDKSDSVFGLAPIELKEEILAANTDRKPEDLIIREEGGCIEYVNIGEKDIELAQRLISGGPVHSKFLRQINISMDITAPLYVWKELDTYKVGTVANSCSTMHTIANHPITLDCFEIEDFNNLEYPYTEQRKEAAGFADQNFVQMHLIPYLEYLRTEYLKYKKLADNTENYIDAATYVKTAKKYWKELIRWLPEGWLQKRTWTCNYEVARNILKWRDPHRLTEWIPICDALKSLPYADYLLTCKI